MAVAKPAVAQPIRSTSVRAWGTMFFPAMRRIALIRCPRLRPSRRTSNASSTAVTARRVPPTARGPPCRSSGIAPLARQPIALRCQDNWVRSACSPGLPGC
ncbi:MAG: hypothetical protein QOD82_2762 [Pseudonocardiales bacterium]|nr:hypothetical protein [Pseudonocardiales bacterium]